VCVVSCRYLKAISDVDVELSVPTKSLDVSPLLLFFYKLFTVNCGGDLA